MLYAKVNANALSLCCKQNVCIYLFLFFWSIIGDFFKNVFFACLLHFVQGTLKGVSRTHTHPLIKLSRSHMLYSRDEVAIISLSSLGA